MTSTHAMLLDAGAAAAVEILGIRLPAEMAARFHSPMAHVIRHMVDEYTRRARLAREHSLAAPKHDEVEQSERKVTADIQDECLDTIRTALRNFVVWGLDPVAWIGGRLSTMATHEVFQGLQARLARAGLRPAADGDMRAVALEAPIHAARRAAARAACLACRFSAPADNALHTCNGAADEPLFVIALQREGTSTTWTAEATVPGDLSVEGPMPGFPDARLVELPSGGIRARAGHADVAVALASVKAAALSELATLASLGKPLPPAVEALFATTGGTP